MITIGEITMKDLAPFLLVGTVLIIIVLLALLVRFIYNMSLNRSLKGSSEDGSGRPQLHTKTPDPSSVFFLLVTGILIAMIFFLVIQNVKLNDELTDLKSSVDRLSDTLYFDSNQRINNIDDKLYDLRLKVSNLSNAFRTIALSEKWTDDPFFLSDDSDDYSENTPAEETIDLRVSDYVYDFDFCSYDAKTGYVPFTLRVRFLVKDNDYYRMERAYLNLLGNNSGFRYFEGTVSFEDEYQTVTVKGVLPVNDLNPLLTSKIVIYFPETEALTYSLPVQKSFRIQSLDTSKSSVSVRSYVSSHTTNLNVNLEEPFLPVYRDKIQKAELLILSESGEELYCTDITFSKESGAFVLTDTALPYIEDLTGAQAVVRITNETGYQLIISKFPNETSIADQMTTNTKYQTGFFGSVRFLSPEGDLICEYP